MNRREQKQDIFKIKFKYNTFLKPESVHFLKLNQQIFFFFKVELVFFCFFDFRSNDLRETATDDLSDIGIRCSSVK